MRPFLSYYGGKWMIARRYPAPRHEVIVEPFAGGAGYATRWSDHRVILADLDPKVVGVWSYLIRASRKDIESLPLLEVGQSVNDLNICQEARWLIGWWVNKGAASPYLTLSAWARDPRHSSQFWGVGIRARVAFQVERIRHWQVIHAGYESILSKLVVPRFATWFVDPPYSGTSGRRYPCNIVDYACLGEWCRVLPGQTIVCEQSGADWLPFTSIGENYSTVGRRISGRAVPKEVVWLS